MSKFEDFKSSAMPRVHRASLKELNKARTNSFLKKVMVLFLTIVIGILVSVSVNAQSTAGKKSKIYKTKNRAKPHHYADATFLNRSFRGLQLSPQQSVIREIVAQNLKESKNNSPVELAPLFYTIEGDRLSVNDPYPFLFALEFALQGRIVVIDDQPFINDDHKTFSKYVLVKEVIRSMTDMGAPAERIKTGEIRVANSDVKKPGDLFVRFAVL